MSKQDLLPCPFCGGQINDVMLQIGHDEKCMFLNAIDRKARYADIDCNEAWNTRRIPDDMVQVPREALKRTHKTVGTNKTYSESQVKGYLRDYYERKSRRIKRPQ